MRNAGITRFPADDHAGCHARASWVCLLIPVYMPTKRGHGTQAMSIVVFVCLFVVLLLFTPLRAQTTTRPSNIAHLKSKIKNQQSHFPYRDAVLTLRNPTNQTTEAVRLRWRDGGPAMQFPLVIPPKAQATRAVYLPAVSVSQTYDIDLLPKDEFAVTPITRATAEITWPIDLLTTDAFIDPYALRPFTDQILQWSQTLRKSFYTTLVIMTLAFLGVFFFRHPVHKVVYATAVLLIAGLVLITLPKYFDPSEEVKTVGNDTLLEVRRTTTLPGTNERTRSLSNILAQNYPIYGSLQSMKEDNLIVRENRDVHLTIRPGQSHIFRNRE